MATATFTADTTSIIPNPGQGKCKGNESPLPAINFDTSQADFNLAFANGYRVVTPRDPQIQEFIGSVLSAPFLAKMETMAGRIRTAGLKCNVLFMYEQWGSDIGNPYGGPNWPLGYPTLTRILGHIAQLSPFFKNNADIINTIHGGFLGTYGEWIGADRAGQSGIANPAPTVFEWRADINDWYPTLAARLAVRDALIAASDPRTPISIRNWASITAWFTNPLTAAQAFSGSLQSRISHHNDCVFADNGDAGTYYAQGSTWNGQSVNYDDTTLGNAFRAYHAAIAPFISTGGEPCGGNLRTGCTPILTDGPRYHWRYLRDDWGETTTWDTWTSGGCINEVLRKLGARVQYDGIGHSDTVARGATIRFTVTLRNTGWSRVLDALSRLQVVATNGGTTLTGISSVQLRQMPDQATQTFTIGVDVAVGAGDPTGTYAVHLMMADGNASLAAIRAYKRKPANVFSGGPTWDDTNGRMTTGTTFTVT